MQWWPKGVSSGFLFSHWKNVYFRLMAVLLEVVMQCWPKGVSSGFLFSHWKNVYLQHTDCFSIGF